VKTFRQLLYLSLPYSGRMLLSVLLGIATVAAGVGLLSTSAYLIARAALQPSIAELQVAIVAVRAFGLARGGLRYLERLTTHSAAFRLLTRLRLWFYERLEPLAPAGLTGIHSGDLLARIIGDIEALDDFFVRGLAPIGVALGSASLGALFLAQFDTHLGWELAGFFLLGGLLFPTITFALGRPGGRKLVSLRSRIHILELDTIQGLPDLLLAGGTDQQQADLAALEQALATQQTHDANQRGLASALPALLMDLTVVAIILTLAPRIHSGSLPGYMLPVLLLAAIGIFEAISPLPETSRRLESQLAAAQRLFELTDRPIPVQSPPSPQPLPDRVDLELSNVSFRYRQNEPSVLSRISFKLPMGSSLGLVGPSGAGKSTLIQLITRLWPYSEGTIKLGGIDLRSLDPAGVRACMAVISQSTDLFSGTLRENLLLARPHATESELQRALDRAQLTEFIATLPMGLETSVGERGLKLSGGERQRVAIARAILREAPILILDEFDAHLDLPTRSALMGVVREMIASRTTLIATHRLLGFEYLDHFIVLEGGRMTSSGTHQDLLQASGWYAASYAVQVHELAVEEM